LLPRGSGGRDFDALRRLRRIRVGSMPDLFRRSFFSGRSKSSIPDWLTVMRIDKIAVTNFKGFEELRLEFPEANEASGVSGSFHLLIGPNASGKTSALDALAVAAGAWLLGVPDTESRTIRSEDVRLKVIDYRDTQRVEPQLPTVVVAQGTVLGQSLEWRRTRKWDQTDRMGAKTIQLLAEKAVTAKRRGDPEVLPLVVYYGTGRSWQEPRTPFLRRIGQEPQIAEGFRLRGISIKGKPIGGGEEAASPTDTDIGTEPEDQGLEQKFASALAGYRRGIDPYCNPQDLLSWLKLEQQLAVQERAESHQFQVVKQAINGSIPGCLGVHYHLRLGLLLEIERQGRLPFGALSHGQRNMIAMIGDLAWRAAQLNPHLGAEVLDITPGVVLIDELELHLHPSWQREIVKTLRGLFPSVQFIATTHSPQVIGHLPSRSVQVLARESEGKIRAVAVPQSLGMDSNWILEQIMNTPDRESGTQSRLAEIFAAIDDENFRLAKEWIRDLERTVGLFPELQGARSMVDRLEILLADEKDS
jgi:predicted ATP-binding protein involved in virulence